MRINWSVFLAVSVTVLALFSESSMAAVSLGNQIGQDATTSGLAAAGKNLTAAGDNFVDALVYGAVATGIGLILFGFLQLAQAIRSQQPKGVAWAMILGGVALASIFAFIGFTTTTFYGGDGSMQILSKDIGN